MLFIIGVIIDFVSMCLMGWAFSTTWGWFIIPTFAGAPTLSIPIAIGIITMCKYATAQTELNPAEGNLDANEQFVRACLVQLGSPLLFLGFCWIVHQFV